MRRLRLIALAALILGSTIPGPARAADYSTEYLYVPVHDGTLLHAVLARPADGTPLPTIVCMTPYTLVIGGSSSCGFGPTGAYTYLAVQIRGGGCSGGELDAFVHDRDDYYDVIEWAAAQPWSDGNVGVVGHSYPAALALQAAASEAPHLRAVFLSAGWADIYRDVVYVGGILRPSTGVKFGSGTTQLRLTNNVQPALQRGDRTCAANQATRGPATALYASGLTTISNPFDGPEWQRRSVYPKADRVKVPIFMATGWDDNHIGANRGIFVMYELINGAPKKLWAVPGWHDDIFKVGGPLGLGQQVQRWFDHYLKGVDNGIDADPPVTLFMDPDPSVAPLHLSEWPPPDSVVEWRNVFLGPDAALQDAASQEAGSAGPVTKDGGPGFVTAPLGTPVQVLGPGVLTFWGSAQTADADWIVDLVDIAGSGQQALVRRGRLRSSLRAEDPARSTFWRPWHTMSGPDSLVPGVPTEMRVELAPTAHAFAAGHRIGVIFRAATCVTWRAAVGGDGPGCWPYGPNAGEHREDHEGVGIPDSGTAAVHYGPGMPSRLTFAVLREGGTPGAEPISNQCPFDRAGLQNSESAAVVGAGRIQAMENAPGQVYGEFAIALTGGRGAVSGSSGAIDYHDAAYVAAPQGNHFVAQTIDAMQVASGHALIEGTAVFNLETGHRFCLEVRDVATPGAGSEAFRLWVDTGYLMQVGKVTNGDVAVVP